MKLEKVETIIFDLGGVLIDWNPKYVYRQVFNSDEAVDYFLNNICTSEWNEEQDGGRPIADANQILISKFPHYKLEILAFYERWEEMLGGPILGTVQILQKLISANKYRILALTNWSAETFPIAKSRYDFLDWFDGILVSGEEGIKKPDPQIYKLIVDQYNIDISKAIFIDDNARNILAAKKYGLSSIKFDDPQKLLFEIKHLI